MKNKWKLKTLAKNVIKLGVNDSVTRWWDEGWCEGMYVCLILVWHGLYN